jgi:exonuclease III
LESGAPVVLAGDYNVIPTDLDVYAPERCVDDTLIQPEVRDAYRCLVEQGLDQRRVQDAFCELKPLSSSGDTSRKKW